MRTTTTVILWAAMLAAVSLSCRRERATEGTASAAEERTTVASVAPDFQPLPGATLAGFETSSEFWPTYGGSYANQRYSALDQINRENVSALVPAWIFQTGVTESFETTPLVVGTVMYLTTGSSEVLALNAATGELLWRFTPAVESALLCCGANNRGVAVYDTLVFVGTLGARLIALHQRTGGLVWETAVADPEDGYSITMAPLAYDGKVFVGVSGGKYGIRGFVAAYDAGTGDEVWRWYTIPAPGEAPNGWWGSWRDTDPFGVALQRDLTREQTDSARYAEAWRRGGGAVWMTPAYEPSTGTLYFSVGNPAPALNGTVRPGDNLYTGSVVALDATTGALKWYFQYVPHDVWDLSPGGAPFLFTLDGRRLIGHAGKTGWVYLVDADTGQPVLRSENFVPQESLFAPPSEAGTRVAPGSDGGASWSPVAYSPRTGYVYVPGIHRPMILSRAFQPWQEGRLWLGGSFRISPDDESWGSLTAIDLRTGEIRWQWRTPAPMLGAALATAGDLVFVGQGTGSLEAFDAGNGNLLWRFPTGAGVHGGPVTYSVNGIQYVAVAAGGNHHLGSAKGGSVIAFTLFQRNRPAPEPYPKASYSRQPPIRYGAVRQVPAGTATQPPASDSSPVAR